MKTCCALCLLLIASFVSAADKQATSDYKALVARAKSGDQTVDFSRLRLAYADSADFEKAPDTDPQTKAMWSELRDKNYDAAIKNAEIVLKADYADMDAHYVEYVAYRELKNSELSDIHQFIFHGLLKSITDSGDGKSPDTAFQVIAVHEEYVLLHTMGVALPKQQSLLQDKGHSFDKITFDDPQSGEEKSIYFNVDIPIKHGL